MRVMHKTVCMTAAMLCMAAGATVLPGMEFPVSFRAMPGADVEVFPDGPLVVRVQGPSSKSGVEILPSQENDAWDWSNVGQVGVVVSNRSDRAGHVTVAVVCEGIPPDEAPTRREHLPPHSTREIVVLISDTAYVTDGAVALVGMNGKPPALKDCADFGKTVRVDVFRKSPVPYPFEFAVLKVKPTFAARKPVVIPASGFFPFIDRYGQFKHGDRPGKIHSDEELAAARKAEEAWLAGHRNSPIPDADKYGGWAGGPQLKATGFFRTEKVDGKWWFVDPDGHLFFSLGIECLYAGTGTPVAGRENYFEELSQAEIGVTNRNPVSFLQHNLQRKYGSKWNEAFARTVHTRFKAWGVNTLGNWCWDWRIWTQRKTPYVATIDFSSKTALPNLGKGCGGRKVPDVNSAKFVEDLTKSAEWYARQIRNDPWCLGVFVDNELDWFACGEEVSAVAEKYYSTVRAVLKKSLPNHLYLGSRIHRAPSAVYLSAARHCDVVSCNCYEREPSYHANIRPDGPDKPIIIGEFHFGAKDRGFFTGGLVTVYDQDERGRCFRRYVEACLENPHYVGCHWFQYQDQPVSGRSDGENYNCGFVNICDIPYPEMVEASRAVAVQMYVRRYGKLLDKQKPTKGKPE